MAESPASPPPCYHLSIVFAELQLRPPEPPPAERLQQQHAGEVGRPRPATPPVTPSALATPLPMPRPLPHAPPPMPESRPLSRPLLQCPTHCHGSSPLPRPITAPPVAPPLLPMPRPRPLTSPGPSQAPAPSANAHSDPRPASCPGPAPNPILGLDVHHLLVTLWFMGFRFSLALKMDFRPQVQQGLPWYPQRSASMDTKVQGLMSFL